MRAAASSDAPAPFELYGPLPSGTTLLEASAGTGKTYAIATLTARFVAEGCPLERLLVITFTRAATGELRTRVRERLVAARDGLDRVLSGDGLATGDELVALLATGDRALVVRRRDRLARALAQFDAATIDTTHGFCHRVLAELGVAGDAARTLTLVEDVSDLVEQVVDDLYLRKYVRRGAPDLSRSDALELGLKVTQHPSVRLTPEPEGDGLPSLRRRLADAVRRETDRRKHLLGLITFDDVLERLRDTLLHERRGPAACARLRERYEVVLIDEFQDTDPVQWAILERAFGRGGSTLVLIGDPKQAIYAFRGADVQTYLDAARTATARATLATNWRSDAPLVAALDALLLDTELGDPAIVYHHVEAAARNDAARLVGAPEPAALRIRRMARSASGRPGADVRAEAARRFIADDLAADVARLLASPASLETERHGREPLQPGDVAVLVRKNSEAELVRDALGRRGVPAVIVAPGSVFATPAASEWLSLLEALQQPTSRARVGAAALTSFLGWEARRLALAGDDELDLLHADLQAWAVVLRERGVASLLAAIESATRLPGRLLARRDGERVLTDLHHVGELLHAEAASSGAGPAALVTWLRERIAEADGPAATTASAEERSRRLESDAAAVQVLTIHRSKGLEFPVVYCPFMWVGPTTKSGVAFPLFHDPDAGNARTLDVGGQRPGMQAFVERSLAEDRDEDLRLLYVALTRARHQVVCWWAPVSYAGRSPLGRILFARTDDGSVGPGGANPDDATVSARLEALAAAAPGSIALEEATPTAARYRPEAPDAGRLVLARLRRELDTAWRRLSYSSLTAPAHDGDDLPLSQLDDELLSGGIIAAPGSQAAAALRELVVPLATAPGGAAFGTVVHAVLERSDFSARDLRSVLRRELDDEVSWRRVAVGDRQVLVEGLAAALETPLGPALGERRLADVSRADRLDELGFELPLVGGDHPHASLELEELGRLLTRLLAPGDPVVAYAPRLAEPSIKASLRGYLTGSLDLVVRSSGGAYAVCDYKTNRVASGDGPLSAYDYRPAALAAEMARCHYPLQALFYLVALHRYLRWRLRDYEPSRHLAGAHYLFLRGMTGDARVRVDGQPCGVWSWQPPAGVVEAVSDLLDEGAR